MSEEIKTLEQQIAELSQRVAQLRTHAVEKADIPNYTFKTLTGNVDLASLFAGKDTLFAIHNMGQGCRYCTLWADGLNGFLPHLEDQFSVVLLSKDSPAIQQKIAHSRGWRFRMASHEGGVYLKEQTVLPGDDNMPGMVCYQKQDGKIIRKSSAIFGPGDQYCSFWHVIGLAGRSDGDVTPQYDYWQRSSVCCMEDGGENLL